MTGADNTTTERITVFLADDNLLVREGVRALLNLAPDLEVVGTAEDYDSLVAGATEAHPDVVVTDIRMPPDFQDEGIAAAKEVRKRHPGTGVVILSQYDDPEYAISLLDEGSAGYGYLLKDRVGDGNRLVDAIREVATGGSVLDPEIVEALVAPARDEGELSWQEDALLRLIAQGTPVKGIAASWDAPAEAVSDAIDALFLKLAEGASAGREGALRRLRMLQQAIVDREEQGETLSRFLPGGLAEKLRTDRDAIDRTERLTVTVLMSDVRGYSGIAEHADPTVLAGQLRTHRQEMNAAILEEEGTVMQYVGDAVMAVFGAPFPYDDHAERALRAAQAMHRRQAAVDADWATQGLAAFGLGIGLSTGEVAAALLGSDERLEYTVVGDTVNLSQRLQDAARPAGHDPAQRADRRRPGRAPARPRPRRGAPGQGPRRRRAGLPPLPGVGPDPFWPPILRPWPVGSEARRGRRPGGGVPAQADVGRAFLVVAVRPPDLGEAVPLVEAPGPRVGLEGPELEPVRSPLLGPVEQLRSEAPTGVSGVHVQLVHPTGIEHEQAHDGAFDLRHPGLPGGHHDIGEPGPDLVVAVDRRRDGRQRRPPGAQPCLGHGRRIRRRRLPDRRGGHDGIVARG